MKAIKSFLRRLFQSKHDRVLDDYNTALSTDVALEVSRMIKTLDADGLSYLGEAALTDLAQAAIFVERNNVPGIFVETGCALGGSAILLTVCKRPAKKLACFDVFAMIPKPGDEDGDAVHQRYEEIASGKSKGIKDGHQYYGYRQNLRDIVKENFSRKGFPIADNNVELIEGLYENTLHVDEPIAFVHIDCDWYASVKVCLDRLAPHLSIGGVMVIDDYHCYAGCTRAVEEFLAENKGMYARTMKNRLHLIKL